VSPNSVCNHTRDKHIGLPLRGRPPDFVITLMITDRIGLHSVLLQLLTAHSFIGNQKSTLIVLGEKSHRKRHQGWVVRNWGPFLESPGNFSGP